MIKTPKKPTATAPQRRMPTFSFRIQIAKIVTKKLFAKPMAVASASGMFTTAWNPHNMATSANTIRVSCKSSRAVFRQPGKWFKMAGSTISVMMTCRMNKICGTDSLWPASFTKSTMTENPPAAANSTKAPFILPGRARNRPWSVLKFCKMMAFAGRRHALLPTQWQP